MSIIDTKVSGASNREINKEPFEILIVTPPGLETVLLSEVQNNGFKLPKIIRGGVTIQGGWPDVWRANLTLRGASKVLVRIGGFRAFHLAQLDKRARKFPWHEILTRGYSVKVDVNTNRKSKIYHAGAAIERLERAIHETFGAEIAETLESADIIFKVRIDDNNVMISVDSSGAGLHKRGFKQAMGKAPMRETMAALFLQACGYTGDEPVVDPMCGSGTFLIEAAEIAQNLMAGRGRSFAFERFKTYDPVRVDALKAEWPIRKTEHRFYGFDRNVNVIDYANQNAERACVSNVCQFLPTPIETLKRPEGAVKAMKNTGENRLDNSLGNSAKAIGAGCGLVIVNPPYGARIGKKKDLFGLYSRFGAVMRDQFSGWRVGLITSDINLAHATQLPWKPMSEPIAHGGLKVRLFQTDILK